MNNNNKLPEYNILLLGETGTGKSTTISAWANYFQYETFEQARQGQFATIIPTKFTLPDPNDNDGVVEIVANVIDNKEVDNELDDEVGDEVGDEIGDKIDEKTAPGRSVTQSPFSYVFEFEDRILRIIDTPGVGDTSGGTIDKENFTKVLAHIDRHKRLHGIVILFKATDTRTTQQFCYCFTELLVHLHRSACTNLIFCFTFSRNAHYEPGDGFNTIRAFLNKEMKHLNIVLVPHKNCFFIDNEAYRFLAAQKQGYEFNEEDISKFAESWNKSVQQSHKMFDTIVAQAPHDLSSTTLLNIGQKFIEEMARPMIHLKAQINANVSEENCDRLKLKNLRDKKNDLDKIKTIEVEVIESVELSHLRAVCSSEECSEVMINVNGENVRHYKSICHDECNCAEGNETLNITGHPSLKVCSVLSSEQTCTKCGCLWQYHLYIKEDQTRVKKSIYSQDIIAQIQQVKGDIQKVKKNLEALPKTKIEYEKECDKICNVCVKFACNIIKNSNAPFNNFLEPYFDILLDEENKKHNATLDYDPTKYDDLKEYKIVHRQCAEILEKAQIEFHKNVHARQLKLEEISLFKAELLHLTHTGKQFEEIIKTSSWKNITQCVRFRERKLKLNHSFHRPNRTVELIFEYRYFIIAALTLVLALFVMLIMGFK